MMIIGRGDIAKLFHLYTDDDNIVIFASGVSNSLEDDEKEYKKEIDLLINTMKKLSHKQLLVYFSTINVTDPSLQSNRYVQHKKEIEALIPQYSQNFYIFRVPVLIIQSKNIHLLINYLIYHIKNKIEFVVFKNAYRYFMDGAIFFKLIDFYIKNTTERNKIINAILFSEPYSVINLVKIMEDVFNVKGYYELVEKGAYYRVNNDLEYIIQAKFSDIIHQDQTEYLKKSIIKILGYGNI